MNEPQSGSQSGPGSSAMLQGPPIPRRSLSMTSRSKIRPPPLGIPDQQYPGLRNASSNSLLSPLTPSNPLYPTSAKTLHTPTAPPMNFRRTHSDDPSSSSASSARNRSNTEITREPRHVTKGKRGYAKNSEDEMMRARLKMSSQDQEAMAKLRSTLIVSGPSSGASSRVGSQDVSRTNSNSMPPSPLRSVFGRPEGEDGLLTSTPMQMEISATSDASQLETPPLFIDEVYSGPPERTADFTIAVIGHAEVGKSTIIRRAARQWGVSSPVIAELPGGFSISSCYSTVPPHGKLKQSRKIEFVELDLASLEVKPDEPKLWPEGVPTIAGVIICYDATRSSTLRGFSDVLGKLHENPVPMVVLACKSDPLTHLDIDAAYANSLAEPFNVGLIEVTTQTSEGKSKIRNGLRWMLVKLENRSRRKRSTMNTTPPNISPSIKSAATSTPTEFMVSESDGQSSTSGDRILYGHAQQRSLEISGSEASDHRSSSSSLQWMMQAPVIRQHDTETTVKALADNQENGVGAVERLDRDGSGSTLEVDVTVLPKSIGTEGESDPSIWVSMEQLNRRLFSAIVSTQDDEFVRSFFMTYRRFCPPLHLMREFRSRFQDVESAQISKDVKHWALMKLTGALIDWTTLYPGDIIDEGTQTVFREILAIALRHSFMGHLVAELLSLEEALTEFEDVDQSWSLPSTSSPPQSAVSELVIGSEDVYELGDSSQSQRQAKSTINRALNSSTQSLAPSSVAQESIALSASTRNSEMKQLNGNLNGSMNGMMDETGFGKWSNACTIVLQGDPRTFAVELTKMQWEKFISIRPRDIFRHDLGKEKDDPVGKGILFFNHLSRWVTTMILANPKAKHRAKMYERFMIIAHHLRRLNNYDSLYAVISGMRETSVHRLSQTHALVNPVAPGSKEFQSHLKLMDPKGGYTHYRRALSADIDHGASAIPLLTTVIGMINRLQNVRSEDRKSDGLIQWDKFSKFGEILSVITECQERGPMVPGEVSPAFQSLIEDTPIILNEDGLFERSRMLEPPNGAQQGGRVMKRFANLAI